MDSRTGYRQEMAYQIYVVACALIVPFSLFTMTQGHVLVAIPPFVTALFCLVNVLCYKYKSYFFFPPLIISILYLLECAAVVNVLGLSGAYWVFPVMIAIYWVHERKVATYLAGFLAILVLISAFSKFELTEAARLSVALIMTVVFFNGAAKIIEKQYKKLEKMTVTDHLTGAYNRRYMDKKINDLLEGYNRNKNISSIITFDIDNFKKINDQYGHSVGDKVLVEIAKNTRERVRTLDRVCRSGGEEFVILLPDTGEDEARLLCEKLRTSISQLPLLQSVTVTISCGVSAVVANDTKDNWLKRSDQAMYKAKNNGKNTVVVSNQINFSDDYAKA